jgi:hypothetical protein
MKRVKRSHSPILMGTRMERFVDNLRWAMGLLASPQLRPALRITFLGPEEGGL